MAEEDYELGELKMKLQAIAAANPIKRCSFVQMPLCPMKVAQLMAACTMGHKTWNGYRTV